MINPAEEIVNIWLQECKKYFVITNIVVHKESRVVNGKRRGGGRGKEIDFFATDGNGRFFWVEVSVSPSPRIENAANRLEDCVNKARDKFLKEKELFLKQNFKQAQQIEKLFIYSSKLFPKKSNEEKRFRDILLQDKINAIDFDQIIKTVCDTLNYLGYDQARNYLFLFKKFLL